MRPSFTCDFVIPEEPCRCVFLSKAGLSLEKLFGPSSAISIALSTRRQGQGELADDHGKRLHLFRQQPFKFDGLAMLLHVASFVTHALIVVVIQPNVSRNISQSFHRPTFHVPACVQDKNCFWMQMLLDNCCSICIELSNRSPIETGCIKISQIQECHQLVKPCWFLFTYLISQAKSQQGLSGAPSLSTCANHLKVSLAVGRL
mmetsp:Transcript_59080/g.129564  ORF Transcript_59080/g.129564 Transcript_59080/m.129564 type:complete len:203 (+) Transcript_59080:159-767(+)